MPEVINSLDMLFPPFAEQVRKFDVQAQAYGFFVYETFRSFDRQMETWKQGRELRNGVWVVVNASKVVTKAKPGSSTHQYGLGIDAIPDGDFSKQGIQWSWSDTMKDRAGKVIPVPWKTIGKISASCGLEWGGMWKKFPDIPHHQNLFGCRISDLYQLLMSDGLESVWRMLYTRIPTIHPVVSVPIKIEVKPVVTPVVAEEDLGNHMATQPPKTSILLSFLTFIGSLFTRKN